MTDNETEDDAKLADAVYKTVNQKLDPPPYIFSGLSPEQDESLFKALGTSKYLHYTPRGKRYHPLVVEYFKRWGDKYLNGLRVARRLLSKN